MLSLAVGNLSLAGCQACNTLGGTLGFSLLIVYIVQEQN